MDLPDSFWAKLNGSFVQKDIRELFEFNQITKCAFLNMEFADLVVLGVRYFSDRKRLIEAQRTLKGNDQQPGKGTGKRTDIGNLEASWNAVEEWRKKKGPFQGASAKKKKEFHVTKMCFNRQKQLAAVKGEIPQMVSSVPTLAEVKLSCWNHFEERDDVFLPSGLKISITDNSKKKTIAQIKNDAQLLKSLCIGYLCEDKSDEKESSDDDLSHAASAVFNKSRTKSLAKCQGTPLWDRACFRDVPDWNAGPSDVKSKKSSFQLVTAHTVKEKSTTHVVVDGDISFKKPDLASIEIDENDLQLLNAIGKGQFGKVYKGLWKGLQVAVKEIPKGYGKPDLTEIDICRCLRHPNVLMMLGCAVTDTDILIVTNYIKGCNLAVALGLMQSKTAKILDKKYNGFVLYTAAQGAAYLHEKGVIHQDLKPANIMVEEPSNRAIICDLGVGKIKSAMTMVTREGANAGTLSYQHIEQLTGKPATPSVDVYSFGVIVLEVHTRTPAWDGRSCVEVLAEINKGRFPSIPDNVPEGAKAIIERCFKESKQRPSFIELLPFLQSIVEVEIW